MKCIFQCRWRLCRYLNTSSWKIINSMINANDRWNVGCHSCCNGSLPLVCWYCMVIIFCRCFGQPRMRCIPMTMKCILCIFDISRQQSVVYVICGIEIPVFTYRLFIKMNPHKEIQFIETPSQFHTLIFSNVKLKLLSSFEEKKIVSQR